MATEPIAYIKALYEQLRRCVRASGNKDKSHADTPLGWAGLEYDPDLLAELKIALASAIIKSPRNLELLELAAQVCFNIDDPDLLLTVLEKWKKADKKSIAPYIYRAEYYFHDKRLSYAGFIAELKDALNINSDSIDIMTMAYFGAQEEGDDARRLFYACNIAERKHVPNWFYIYGTELINNLMNKKAESVFRLGLQQDARHLNCMLGLGACYLERLEIDNAEKWFSESMKIKETDFAKQSLETIKQLKDNKAWTDLEQKQKGFWNGWAKRQLQEITTAEQKKLLAECFVRK